MRDIGVNVLPTHDDMALIPAQGRDGVSVQQDVIAAKEQVHAQRMNPAYKGPQQGAIGTMSSAPHVNVTAEKE